MNEKQQQEKKLIEFIDRKYEEFTLEEKQDIHRLYILKNKQPKEFEQLIKKLEKFIFKITPPTPQEYLDHRNGWITKPFQEACYKHVAEDFIEILNPEKNYNQISTYGATRLGKSYTIRMIIHYIIIYLHCLRQPQLYYNLAPTTSLSIYIMSFVGEKVNQLLLEPIYKIFNMCPRMEKIHLKDKVAEDQYKKGPNNIVWSKASTFGHITLASDVSLNSGTDFLSFIGADLLFLSVSEINFFIQQAGTTHEEIFQLYSDGLERIKATVGDQYLGMVFLDSSANDTENTIENYILNELPKQDKVYFTHRARWDAEQHKKKYKKWLKTGKTFKVCIGNGSTTAKIIKDEEELKDINPDLIINVPIDLKPDFERNLIKSIKDIAGRPTIKENKLINKIELIDNIWDNNLNNIMGSIIADAAFIPEKLIWNQIKDKFFTKTIDQKWKLKRANSEPRWIHIDHAFSSKGDLLGISMGHKELSMELNKKLYIIDFAFAIAPQQTGINLAAIEQFIFDLRNEGNIFIKKVSSDSFQNATFKQNLIRNKIDTTVLSLDRTILPYMTMLTLLNDKLVKCGKNIFLKNNLISLMIIKGNNGNEKIDHSIGTVQRIYNGDWNKSDAGKNGKDVSDTFGGVIFSMFNDDYIPSTIYELENKKYSENKEDNKEIIENALSELHKYIS